MEFKIQTNLRQLHHWRQAFVLPTLTSSLQGLLGNRDPAASPPGHLPLWMKAMKGSENLKIFWYSYDNPMIFLISSLPILKLSMIEPPKNLNRCRHCTWRYLILQQSLVIAGSLLPCVLAASAGQTAKSGCCMNLIPRDCLASGICFYRWLNP